MTTISLTSGEIMDIISLIEHKANNCGDEKPHLAAYYSNLQDQFQQILDKVYEFQPEYRVAHLVLACN